MQVGGDANRVVGAGGHHNDLGDRHYHFHLGKEPQTPPDRPEPVTAWRAQQLNVHPARAVDTSLHGVVEDLADQVLHRLGVQIEQDKATDPILMPVRWTAAQEYPADHWANVRGEREDCAAVPLAGMIDQVAALYASIPSGRLVVLGEGGAGKSVLVRELAWRLLQRRSGDSPVPIIFRLSSWDPAKLHLKHWLEIQLGEDYPTLAARQTRRGPTLAARLLEAGVILPILDGLDELAEDSRPEAVRGINRALRLGGRLVLASRPAEYVAAVERGDVVTGAAVVALQDLSTEDLAAYLPRTAGRLAGPSAGTKWAPVVERLRGQEADTLREVLSTPLMASLARSVYSDTPADPCDLLDRDRFPDAAALTDHLLDRFVHVAFEPAPPHPGAARRVRATPAQAVRWLGFLAVWMFAQDEREFAWWKHWRMPSTSLLNRPQDALMACLFALAYPLGAVGVVWRNGAAEPLGAIGVLLVICAIFSATAAIATREGRTAEPRSLTRPHAWIKPPEDRIGFREIWRTAVGRDLLTLFVLVFLAWWAVLLSTPDYFSAVLHSPRRLTLFGTLEASTLLFCLGWLAVFLSAPTTSVDRSDPHLMLRWDRRTALFRGCCYGLLISGMCAAMWVPFGRTRWLAAVPLLMAGSVLCAVLASSYGAWLIRCLAFAANEWLPWRCMAFLEDAYAKGVLRRAGGAYQFRHAHLQQRLAEQFIQGLEDREERALRNRTMLYVRADLAGVRLRRGQSDAGAESEVRAILDQHRRSRHRYGIVTTWPLLVSLLRHDGQSEDALAEARAYREYASTLGGHRRWWYWQRLSRRVLADTLSDAGLPAEALAVYAELEGVMEEQMRGDDLDEEIAEVRAVVAALRKKPAPQEK